MDLINDISHVKSVHRGSVAALGNFDGVHPGHRAVVDRAGAEAKKSGAPHAVIAFEPHPRQYFRPNDPPFRLMSLRSKARVLEALGVDVLFALPFNKALAETEAEDFVRQVLVAALGIGHVVVGADFHFGRGRGGDAQLLTDMGASEGFDVSIVDMVGGQSSSDPSQAFSSTDIRAALREGNVVRAAQLLGRPWSVDGIVSRGAQRGRKIGFPTINLPMSDYLRPKFGGYVFRVDVFSGEDVQTYGGVGNVGVRPTFGKSDVVLEVHLLDFDGDIYGREVFVHFIDYLRPEIKFDGVEALIAQIEADCDLARSILASSG